MGTASNATITCPAPGSRGTASMSSRVVVGIGASSSCGLLQPLDDHGVGETARLADHLEAEAAVALLQRIEQRRGQSSPGRAERMAKRDGAAADVDPAEVGPDLAGP